MDETGASSRPASSSVEPSVAAERPASTPSRADWRELIRKLGAIGPLALIAATLPALGGFILLYYSQTVGDWLRSHGQIGPLIYVAAFVTLAGLALLPTYAQAIIGGFAFGLWVGTASALAGFVGAALVGYAIARYFSGDRAEQVIAEHPKWQAVYDELLHGGFFKTFGIVTLIRVPPNSPFAMTNLVLAATRTPLAIYVVGTLVGMAPRTAAAVYIGSTLSDLSEVERPWWMVAGSILLALIVVGVIGALANRAISHVAGVRPATQGASAPSES
ncbi:MAG: TVP38/TMEM64 family protein [Planctomycetota bacterium]|nr:MAG: TVP38/TMEM64 family protein [Planctomycetota bacterium]